MHQVPVIMPTSGYATPNGYTHLPPESQRPTSNVSCTVNHIQQTHNLHKHLFQILGCLVFTFKKKCAWCPEHETQIFANLHKKAGCLLSSLFLKARKKDKKPRWILYEDWEKLVEHWETNARFKQMSEIGKMSRSSTKGGSLHTSGAHSQGNVRRKLEKELGRSVTQAEAFKFTHTRKKKNLGDPNFGIKIFKPWRISTKLYQKTTKACQLAKSRTREFGWTMLVVQLDMDMLMACRKGPFVNFILS